MRAFSPGRLLALAATAAVFACGGGGGNPSAPTASVATPAPGPAGTEVESLAAAASAAGKLVGAAVQASLLGQADYAAVFGRHFSYVTAEWEMKWNPVQRQPGVYDFSGGDQIVAFAEGRGMRVKGHALVWHGSTPDWVSALTAPELRIAVEDHIRTVAGHWRGRVHAWDVVNEAVADDREATGDGLRRTVYYEKLGPGYIAEAFRLARRADPAALLVYNDYSAEGRGAKSDRVYELVKGLKQQGVPIDGVGLQMHIDASGSPAAADVAWNMRRLADLGLLVNISEMDVRTASSPGDAAARQERQKQVYKAIVAACVAEPRCDAVTLWGFTDKYSWIDKQFGPDDPLIFDESYRAKPAFFGMLEAFQRR
jgi:endo-1,4-beta-xylanase